MLLALLVAGGAGHAGAQSEIGLLDAFRTAPLPSASAGIIYRYDPTTGTFVRESEVAGQIYMERPATVGAGAWNLSSSYQFADLHFDLPNVFREDAEIHEIFASAIYGVTDDLDVGLTVPVIYFHITADLSSQFGGGRVASTSDLTVDPIFIRAKYRLVDRPYLQLSTGLVIQMLTQSLFDGGNRRVQPGFYLYASRDRVPVGGSMFLQPYVNVGVDWFEDDVDHPEVKWAVGMDWNVTSRFTPAVAFLATHQPNTPSVKDSYAVSVGARVSLWGDTLIGFANVLFLVDVGTSGLGPFSGVRERVGPFSEVNAIPLVGIEATL